MHVTISKNILSLFDKYSIYFSDNGRPRFKVGDSIYLDNNAQFEPYSAFNEGRCLVKMGAFSYSQSPFTKVVGLDIGRYCSIAKGLRIQGTNHPIHRFTTSPVTYDSQFVIIKQSLAAHKASGFHTVANPKDGVNNAPINIGNDVWIGENVTIARGVTIGDGAIVGSNALVSKNVPPYAIVGGLPAKIINYRFSAEMISELIALKWWDYAYWDFAEHNLDDDIESFINLVKAKIVDKKLLPYSPAILDAKDVFIQSVKDIVASEDGKIDFRDVDLCINIALKIEKQDLDKALMLMRAAHKIRPHGPLIVKKIAQYQKSITQQRLVID